MLTKCKGIIQQGPNKGDNCKKNSINDTEYCGKHERWIAYDLLIKDGKIPCLDFFRGCSEVVIKEGRCAACRAKKSVKDTPCAAKDCPNSTTGDKYCGKHHKKIYEDEEKEKNIKYCDIDRSCFNLCTPGYATCEPCRTASYEKEKARKAIRKENRAAIELNKDAKMQICIKCGCEYEQFNTSHGKPSMRCLKCNKNQADQDAKRKDRVRNYKNENFRSMENYFANYTKSAYIRGHSMSLSYEDFKGLVTMPCYYCLHKVENEVNGIDRINNAVGYEPDNCVPCCETCNMMKHYFHPLFFIEMCRLISGKQTATKDFYKKWKEYYGRSNYHNYTNYKITAETVRGMAFNITQEEWDKITRQPCYLCGYQDSKGVGIDRVDNTKREYNADNIKPCCGTCNDIKGEYPIDIIKGKAQEISDIWKETIIFESYPRIKNPMREGPRKKNEIIEEEDLPERKVWKSLGVYYDILSEGTKFFDSQGEKLKEEEYNELLETVKTQPREEALAYIKGILNKLNIRRNK